MKKNKIKKVIGEYWYCLEENSVKVEGDWVVSKYQIKNQIDNTTDFIYGLFNSPFPINISQCILNDVSKELFAFIFVTGLSGNILQENTYKIIDTNDPNVKFKTD